jgi:hypothetical protein
MTRLSSWKHKTDRERADVVRWHFREQYTLEQVCELFDLTIEGAIAIWLGQDWRPDFERSRELVR